MKMHKHKPHKPERRALETRKCTDNLRRLVVGFRSHLEDELRRAGLTLPQLRMLKAVRSQGGEVSAAALARTSMVTPQTMQAILSRAVAARWIVRGKSAKNERIVTASLTPLGEDVLQKGLAMMTAIEERIWHDVPLSELRRLNETLATGIAALEGPAA